MASIPEIMGTWAIILGTLEVQVSPGCEEVVLMDGKRAVAGESGSETSLPAQRSEALSIFPKLGCC